MPPKKQTKDNAKRTAGVIRTRQETLVDQVVAQVSVGFNDKFERLEQAIAAIAPAAPERQQENKAQKILKSPWFSQKMIVIQTMR